MFKLTRRRFLQASTMAAAASALSGCSLNLEPVQYLESNVEPPEDGLPGENLWYASTCRQCSAGCGILIRVSNGRARKIEGNPAHPLNKGKLCARGQAALQELYDPDRLQNAVVQSGGRGSLEFEPIFWESALYELGKRLRDAANSDPAGIAFLAGNMSSSLSTIAHLFAESLGAPPPVVYSLADEFDGRATLNQASEQLFGAPGIPVYDIAQADAVFSFGANLLETWLSPVSQSRAYSQMRRQSMGLRGYLAQFESRMSSTAASADEWIAVKPGTEGLVALALGKIISLEERVHAEWYEDIDVEEMAELSGVPLSKLMDLARILLSVSSPVAIAGNALAGQQNSLSAITAVQALNELLGRMGQPGGVFLPETALPPEPVSTYDDVEGLIGRMREGQVSVLMIAGWNPVFELPREAGFVEALNHVPLVVCFSSTVDETVAQSDLALPDHTNLEGWGYQLPTGADRPAVSGQQGVVKPLYDTRSTVDVLLELSKLPGMGAGLPWASGEEFLREVAAELGISWFDWRRQGGWWEEETRLRAPAADFGPFSVAVPTFEGEGAEYDFHLYPYPSIALVDGRGANKAWLQETPDPMTTVSWQTWVEINPETAAGLGLADNDVVRVISPAGEVEAIVYVYSGIPRDVVAMPIGQGHQDYGRFAMNNGSNPVEILVPGVNAETGALAWGSTRVRLEKTESTQELSRLESPEGVEFMQAEGEH